MGVNNSKTTFVLGSGLYDFGKSLVLVYFPTISALYFGLGQIWKFPAIEEVVGSIAVICTVFGGLLHVSNSQYKSSGAAYDGTVTATPTEVGTDIKFNVDPHDLVNKDAVILKVQSPGPQ